MFCWDKQRCENNQCQITNSQFSANGFPKLNDVGIVSGLNINQRLHLSFRTVLMLQTTFFLLPFFVWDASVWKVASSCFFSNFQTHLENHENVQTYRGSHVFCFLKHNSSHPPGTRYQLVMVTNTTSVYKTWSPGWGRLFKTSQLVVMKQQMKNKLLLRVWSWITEDGSSQQAHLRCSLQATLTVSDTSS